MDAAGSPGPSGAGASAQAREPAERGEPSLHVAVGLFLIVGVPFLVMAALTILARAGLYVDAFRGLYSPWPPDVLKPFIGLGAFAATLGYLTYRLGRRSGFHKGKVAGMIFVRNQIADGSPRATVEVPPPPPVDARADEPPVVESAELDAMLRP